MDVLGMHSEVNRLIQSKLSTYAIEEVNQWEVDAALNKAVLTFLMENFNPTSNKLQQGFEQTKIRTAQISNLVVTNYPLSASVEGDVAVVALPSNCMWFLSSRSEVWYDCRKTPTTTTYTEKLAFIPFLPSEDRLPSYSFSGFGLSATNGTPITFNIPSFEKDKYRYPYNVTSFALNYVEEFNKVNPSGFKIYFESYKNIYKQNTFILVSPNNTYTSTTFTYSSGKTQTVSFETINFIEYVTTGLSKNNILNRFGPQDDVWVMQEDPFNKSTYDNTLSYESERKIHVLLNQDFAVKNVLLNYIKIPREISLNLNQSCELSVAFHPTICRMAATELLEIVTSRRFETSSLVKNE